MQRSFLCRNGHDLTVPSRDNQIGSERGWRPVMHCSRCGINETILEYETANPLGHLVHLVESALDRVSFGVLTVAAVAFLWVALPRIEDKKKAGKA